MEISNQVRGFSFFSGVLKNREGDPFCRSCNSFQTVLSTVHENLLKFEREHSAEIEKLPNELSLFFLVAKSGISGIRLAERPVAQKKAGNCRLPEGVCFLKSSLALLQKI